jgi:hypothetical protein
MIMTILLAILCLPACSEMDYSASETDNNADAGNSPA